jgi:acyl-CoA dehydrogenase
MAWDFETDPEYQEKLDWADTFLREEVEPLDFVVSATDIHNPLWQEVVPPLQAKVKEQGLWATHLGPELGGPGFGQVKLALLNEILGRSGLGPTVFGCAAPDTGNMEILAHYGTPQQKERWLKPLLDGEILSAYSMTEPQGGADPTALLTTAELDGDEWVINGEKWFTTNAVQAEFLIMFVVTDPDAPPHRRASMLIVPMDTAGVEIVRNISVRWRADREGSEAYLRMVNARVPRENLLGEPGEAFAIAQTRLGGGRIHHAMRTVGSVKRAFDLMCERAVSRTTKGEQLARKQLVQEMIADSWIEMEQFRLLVLRTAWRIDRYHDYKRVRGDIAAVKAAMPRVLNNVASRALQVHGSLGVTNEMPFIDMVINSFVIGLADGPTEVHKITLARQITGQYEPNPDLFPSKHIPKLRDESRKRYADVLARFAEETPTPDGRASKDADVPAR